MGWASDVEFIAAEFCDVFDGAGSVEYGAYPLIDLCMLVAWWVLV